MEEVGFVSCCIFLTTEYTEAGQPYLKDTETGLEGLEGLEDLKGLESLVSVGERSDLSRVLEWLKGGEWRGRFGFIINQNWGLTGEKNGIIIDIQGGLGSFGGWPMA